MVTQVIIRNLLSIYFYYGQHYIELESSKWVQPLLIFQRLAVREHMKKGPTQKSDRFFKFLLQKRSLASKPFMPHFDINYIISKQGKKSYDFFPCYHCTPNRHIYMFIWLFYFIINNPLHPYKYFLSLQSQHRK